MQRRSAEPPQAAWTASRLAASADRGPAVLVIVVYDFWDGERMDSVAKRAPIELPVACTLVAPDGAQRMKQWKALQVKGRPSARRDGHQLIVACRAEPGVQWEL
jgi:hypothetical protein